MTWIDFKAVRQAVSLEQVLTQMYRLPSLRREGDRLVGPCPVHGGDNPRAFQADLPKNLWHCFSRCQGGGNQLDFVVKKEAVSVREAALRIAAHFHLDMTGPPPLLPVEPTGAAAPDSPSRTEKSPGREPEPDTDERPGNRPIEVRLVLSREHPHLEQRGLTPATIEAFGVGYCPKGILRGMIAIPIRDQHGHLIGYAGRRLRPEEIREDGKYKFPKGFRKELVLFNLDRVKARDRVIVVEGFFTTMLLVQRGIQNVVSTMGATLSEAQADQLASFSDVILLFDGDDAGRHAAERAKALLGDRTTVRQVTLPEGFEPEDLPPRALRFLLAGLTELDLAEISLTPRVLRPITPS